MQRGFTIIELVMILTLIAILAAVAIPRFSGYGAIKQRNAVLKIASDIRYAQNRATTTQQRHRINFNTSTTYDIQFCNGIYDTATCTCATLPWPTVKTIDLSTDFSDVAISLLPVTVTWLEFDSLGRPYVNPCSVNSAGATVTVSYIGEANIPINIQQQTGMVSY